MKCIIFYFKDVQSSNSFLSQSNENEDSTKALVNSSAAAAAKRKGSFKKWLRSSHRKFTSNNGGASTSGNRGGIIKTDNSNGNHQTVNPQQKYLNLSSSSDLKVRNEGFQFDWLQLKCSPFLGIHSSNNFWKIKKVLSNSDDIKMKSWLIEEHNEELDENNDDLEENSVNDQVTY